MVLTDLQLLPLNLEIDCFSFDCDDNPINEFIHFEALDYQKEYLGNTYVLVCSQNIVRAYFTLFNDSLHDFGSSKNKFNREHKIPNSKRRRSYPAIKIGRFGVHKDQQKTGLAYELMDFIKGWVIMENKSAVKFLILDAYNQERQKKFYSNNKFKCIFIDSQSEQDTVLMIFNLSTLR